MEALNSLNYVGAKDSIRKVIVRNNEVSVKQASTVCKSTGEVELVSGVILEF